MSETKMTDQKSKPLYRTGQVVAMKTKDLPFRILDVTEDGGVYFYAWSKRNYAQESMLRPLTVEEISNAG